MEVGLESLVVEEELEPVEELELVEEAAAAGHCYLVYGKLEQVEEADWPGW